MKRLFVLVPLFLTLLACGSEPEAGESCTVDDDCGDAMSCHCVIEEGVVPGVCSDPCTDDAGCAHHGEGYTCSLDFCTGVNVCLNTGG